jgi:hypothetical protein
MYAKTQQEAIERVKIKRELRKRGVIWFRNDDSTESLKELLTTAKEKK